MGRQTVDQSQLFYLFNLEDYIPADHPLIEHVIADCFDRKRDREARALYKWRGVCVPGVVGLELGNVGFL
jgi:hypothetical protein